MTRPTHRSPISGATATTLVVMVAMVTAVSVLPAPAYASPTDSRIRLSESKKVRAVTAAMAAVARNMIGGDPAPVIGTAPLAMLVMGQLSGDGLRPCRAAPRLLPLHPGLELGERRLDLPPPQA